MWVLIGSSVLPNRNTQNILILMIFPSSWIQNRVFSGLWCSQASYLYMAGKRLVFIINHNIFQSLHRKIKELILMIFSSTVKFTDVSTLIHFYNVFLKSLMKRYVIPNLMWRHRCFIILVLLLHYHDGWATTIWH